jgi:hypothetical protein
MDKAGRVERFRRRYSKGEAAPAEATETSETAKK